MKIKYTNIIDIRENNMIKHARAVKRGATNTFTVVDMPFMSYHTSMEESLKNAQKLFQQTGAQALKLEGISEDILTLTKRLTEAGDPIIPHRALTAATQKGRGSPK